MAQTGYTPWAVTAGEQPTTAYWNLLGENDASFNSGSGFNDGILINRHFASNSVKSSNLLYGLVRQRQGGTTGNADWGGFNAGTNNTDISAKDIFIQCGVATMNSGTQVVNFPIAYNFIPIVTITPRGSSGNYTNGNWYLVSESTTSFTIQTNSPNLPNVTWIAIGQ